MPFTWDNEEQEGYCGTGTLLDYLGYGMDFDYKELFSKCSEEFTTKALERYAERDQHLLRLMLELFEKAGCKMNNQIRADCPPDSHNLCGGFNPKTYKFAKGWHMLLIQPDDAIFCLYFDGKPKAAYYASFRGVYNADGWVEDTKESFRAKNYGDESDFPHNTWVKRGDASIPRNMLHYGSIFEPGELEEKEENNEVN